MKDEKLPIEVTFPIWITILSFVGWAVTWRLLRAFEYSLWVAIPGGFLVFILIKTIYYMIAERKLEKFREELESTRKKRWGNHSEENSKNTRGSLDAESKFDKMLKNDIGKSQGMMIFVGVLIAFLIFAVGYVVYEKYYIFHTS
ncbi:hypothetical protein [Pleionea litopenaei]|uniref:Uncharacterized protein n=1 Tax=Pleionea litopenaei TaxID=3070815 RepID=A0AA51RVD1_9GAMM|nr:hypothetical protein [Pleionea sp. HL-JVS1]WMS88272.1 hypothetical protein Q9312_04980 [Pleionea sp. HL-JVS1]